MLLLVCNVPQDTSVMEVVHVLHVQQEHTVQQDQLEKLHVLKIVTVLLNQDLLLHVRLLVPDM